MKKTKIIELALLVISVVILVAFFIGGPYPKGPDTFEKPMLNVLLGWTYIMVAVSILLLVVFTLAKTLKSKKGIRNLIILVIGIVVVVGGAYILAPGNHVELNKVYPEWQFKFTDTALYITYLFVFGSIAALIGGGIYKAIKNK